MILSTGNDLVALQAIDVARTNLPKFYSKILTPAEKRIYDEIKDVLPFEVFVWLLWSVKESAYKFLKRINPALVFSPSHIIVDELKLPASLFSEDLTGGQIENCDFDYDGSIACVVKAADSILYSRSVISGDYIFSTVNAEDTFHNIYWGIKRISSAEPSHQSDAARAFLLNKLDQIFPAGQLYIVKDENNIPFLMNGQEKMPVPVSIAHHDKYIAYSFQLKP